MTSGHSVPQSWTSYTTNISIIKNSIQPKVPRFYAPLGPPHPCLLQNGDWWTTRTVTQYMTTHHYQYMGMWCKFQTALPLWKSSLSKMKIDHVIDVVILSLILSDRYVVASHSQCLEATCMCALSTIFLDSPNPVLFGNHWRWRWRHSSPNLPQKVQLLHNISL